LLKEGPGIARAGASAKKNLTVSRSNLGLSDLAWFDPPVTNSADSFCPSSSPLMAAKNSVLKRQYQLPDGGIVADLDASGDVVLAVGGFVGCDEFSVAIAGANPMASAVAVIARRRVMSPSFPVAN